MSSKAMILVDGENLLLRYQSMLSKGRKARQEVVHKPDQFVWSRAITKKFQWDLIRVAYYTTIVGDDDLLKQVELEISKIEYYYSPDALLTTPLSQKFVVPRIFKKLARQNKSAKVDINIAVDMLRYAYLGGVEHFYLITADADYIPLIQEVMRSARRVVVGGLSEGLSDSLVRVSDRFVDLDPLFFEPES